MKEYTRGRLAPRTIEQFKDQIRSMAMSGAKRAAAIGAPLDVEDFEQELRITTMKCSDRYLDDSPAIFHTYLYTAMWHRIDALLLPHQKKRNLAMTVSVDTKTSTDEDAPTLLDRMSGSEMSPEDQVVYDDLVDSVRGNLSGNSLAMFNMLMNPPAEVIEQYYAKIYGAEYDRKHNGKSRGYPDISIRFLSALFQIAPNEIRRIKRDLKRAVEKHTELSYA